MGLTSLMSVASASMWNGGCNAMSACRSRRSEDRPGAEAKAATLSNTTARGRRTATYTSRVFNRWSVSVSKSPRWSGVVHGRPGKLMAITAGAVRVAVGSVLD